SANAVLQLARLAGLNRERTIGDRKPLRSAVKLGFRTREREDRASGAFGRCVTGRRLRRGGSACDSGRGETHQRRTTGDDAPRPARHSITPWFALRRRATCASKISYSTT